MAKTSKNKILHFNPPIPEAAQSLLEMDYQNLLVYYAATRIVVVGNTDTTEGRGRDVFLGYFQNKDDAEKMAQHAGPMGGPGSLRTVPVIVAKDKNTLQERFIIPIGEGALDLKPELSPRSLALAKLTEQEKKLLGLA